LSNNESFYFNSGFIFLLITTIAVAGPLKGIVIDKITKEPLVGASITVKNSKIGASAGLDGSFIFKQLSPGEYDILVQYVGYESLSKK